MNADRTETTTTLTLNGNNPAEWQLNTPWYDNLGTLFSHDGQSETIYSTTTIHPTRHKHNRRSKRCSPRWRISSQT
jgi:hypothetical protein